MYNNYCQYRKKNVTLRLNNSNSMTKIVIFDLDGTLYDKSGLVPRLLMRQLGHWQDILAERRVRKQMKGCDYGSKEAFYEAFFSLLSNERGKSIETMKAWYQHSYMPAMVEAIKSCNHVTNIPKQNGVVRVLYSDYEWIEEKLHAIGLKTTDFDLVISAPALGGLKPNKALMERLLAKVYAECTHILCRFDQNASEHTIDIASMVNPNEILVLGDRLDTDGACAEAIGARFWQSKCSVLMARGRYSGLAIRKGVFVPDTHLDYPEADSQERMYKPKYDRDIQFDENYPYLDDSFRFKFGNFIVYKLLLYFLIRIFLYVKMGLRVRGRHILDFYRDQLKGGAISIANHVFKMDAACVMLALHSKSTTRIPMFAANFNTKDNFILRHLGGVPIPSTMNAMRKYNAAFDEFHERGYWMHVFPEAARWDFYKPIRPFEKGVFTMAYKYDMPIVPCVITYRQRRGLYKLFAPKNIPLLTVTICDPIFPDTTLPRKEEVERMHTEAHSRMCSVAGIVVNTWPDRKG